MSVRLRVRSCIAVAFVLGVACTTACDGGSANDSSGDAAIGADSGGTPISEEKVDLLWVLDNSSSMCEEQESLRDSFRSFIDRFTESPADFHLAVTTTHNFYATEPPPGGRSNYDRHLFGPDQKPNEDTPLEPVAEAGQIQSYPNPPIAFSPACHFGKRADGTPATDDISPIREQLRQAIQCTKSPSDYEDFGANNRFETLTKCAVIDDPESGGQNDSHSYCEDVQKDDSYSESELVREIFPCGQKLGTTCTKESEFQKVYRELPKVLRASDYAGSDGQLDEEEKEKLQRDFACMSFVGTRGQTFEQGLRNAALAVHPLMTGGPKGDPIEGKSFEHPVTEETVEVQDGTTRPNHGFLRKDARTAVVFVTDENDCSHPDHTILERTRENACGELNCYFPTKEGSPNAGDLMSTSTLWQRFTDNLAKSKRKSSLASNELFVGSLHGWPAPYSSPKHPQGGRHVVPEKCGDSGAPSQSELRESLPVCASELGSAYSGDRYANFLAEAGAAGYTIFPESPTSAGTGLVCNDSLEDPLESIGAALSVER